MKKLIAIAGTVAVLSLAVAFPALAENSANASVKSNSGMAVSISESGRARIEGTVTAVSSSSLSVASWGGTWTVNTGADAKIQGRFGHRVTLANVKVGDKVAVNGKVSGTTSLVIDATILRDLSLKIKPESVSGIISNLSADLKSFTLNLKNGQTVNVSLGSDAKVNLNSTSTASSSLSNGLSVRVKGLLNSGDNSLLGSKVNLNVNADKGGQGKD